VWEKLPIDLLKFTNGRKPLDFSCHIQPGYYLGVSLFSGVKAVILMTTVILVTMEKVYLVYSLSLRYLHGGFVPKPI